MDLINYNNELLQQNITNSDKLINLLMYFTNKKRNEFNILDYYINYVLSKHESNIFFNYTLKGIFKLALSFNKFCKNINILNQNCNNTIQLNRLQIAILLSNSFLCLYKPNNGEFSYMNFDKLYGNKQTNMYNLKNFEDYMKSLALDETKYGDIDDRFKIKLEKLKFMNNYFYKFLLLSENNNFWNSICTFERKCIPFNSDILSNNNILSNINIISQGGIEDSNDNIIKVNFANKYIGGGVLNSGCVQEEILFLTYFELIVTCIIAPRMKDNESILMYNMYKYSDYSDYGFNTKFLNNKIEHIGNFLSIDSINYNGKNTIFQFSKKEILRELYKCYIGFNNNFNTIATGNWGAGMFKSNVELKFLIQLLSASLNNKNLEYYTFSNDNDIKIKKIYDTIINKEKITTNNELYNYILDNYIIL
jgi:poly(ADP-ribose) glycohydrolase